MEQKDIKLTSQLTLHELTMPIHLGISKLEQKAPQIISLNISINQNKEPTGCKSDNIDDTICYDKLCQKIKSRCQNKTYNLIEHLCHDTWILIANELINYKTNNKYNKFIISK